LLASGASPVYPCHITPAQIRQHPIGTGPFKFVEFKPNESIKLTRNPDYWKASRPYLDGIEYAIIPNVSTQVLAAGKFDMTFPYGVSIPVLRELKSQAPRAECELTIDNGSRTMIVNRNAPPFDHADLRRAMALPLDRRAFVDTLTEGQGAIGATRRRSFVRTDSSRSRSALGGWYSCPLTDPCFRWAAGPRREGGRSRSGDVFIRSAGELIGCTSNPL
jgi:peptide/nickel transport system substrate-binding protein